MSSESEIEQPQQQPQQPLKYTVAKRLMTEGRWREAEPVRDELMREARKVKKLPKDEAQDWTYAELDRLYPPLPPPEPEETDPPTNESESEPGDDPISTATEAADLPPAATIELRSRTRGEPTVTGLNEIPVDWPQLSANAALAAEIQWVQANRLRVVSESDGQTVVDLARALVPAPSYSAIGWLETSIRAYSKYCEIAAKATQSMEAETDYVRREKQSIEQIRGLLAEMLEND